MKKLPVFIVIIVTIIWFFCSWYFYTCKIKGFCSLTIKDKKVVDNKINSLIINNKEIKKEKKDLKKAERANIGLMKEGKLNKKKVLKEVKKEEEITKKIKKCKGIITLPIKYGSNFNNSLEVKALEKFLNETQGAKLEINGIYDKKDYNEVKKFQLKYHKDILDPWGIKIPTGYVYNTTIKKINEIYCLNIK